MVLVMTVHPGFGGQGFMTEQLPVIEQIRARIEQSGRDIPIEVDGGIKPRHRRVCAAAAGASLFVSGSFIFHSKNYQRAVAALKENLDELGQTLTASSPHRRKPPTNASVLSPRRQPGGSSSSKRTLPPPRTTYSGSSAA